MPSGSIETTASPALSTSARRPSIERLRVIAGSVGWKKRRRSSGRRGCGRTRRRSAARGSTTVVEARAGRAHSCVQSMIVRVGVRDPERAARRRSPRRRRCRRGSPCATSSLGARRPRDQLADRRRRRLAMRRGSPRIAPTCAARRPRTRTRVVSTLASVEVALRAARAPRSPRAPAGTACTSLGAVDGARSVAPRCPSPRINPQR